MSDNRIKLRMGALELKSIKPFESLVDLTVVCLFFIPNDRLSGKQVGSQASLRVTRQLAWIQTIV